ncbi:hypothetical protein CLOLEP_00493 [[Clostridium] leptum DSM 753]|uniref:Uncharacterized protein n=1 Tax=[Clostridium] leptum DSM 753 TaxID=428125 RepID=A7VPL7_9FIRM|nr:hypothetical protein CLOLEP_00493 [[Clostridium] leptum DSM 753]
MRRLLKTIFNRHGPSQKSGHAGRQRIGRPSCASF